MGFWNSLFNRKQQLNLTYQDIDWVDNNLHWLYQIKPSDEAYSIYEYNATYFPESFHQTINIDLLIGDLCKILKLDKLQLRYELIDDLTSTHGIAYEEDSPFESQLDIHHSILTKTSSFKITVSSSLLKTPNRLLLNLIKLLVQVKMSLMRINFDNGLDTEQFVYLACIRFGFGKIIFPNLKMMVSSNDNNWSTSRVYISNIKTTTIAYAIVKYADMNQDTKLEWRQDMNKESLEELELVLQWYQNR